MRIIDTAISLHLAAKQFANTRVSVGMCELDLRMEFPVNENCKVKVHFFKGSVERTVHVGIYNGDGVLEEGYNETVTILTERDLKAVIETAICSWMVYKLDCMIEKGILKKNTLKPFDICKDPIYETMKRCYAGPDDLEDRINEWNKLGLNKTLMEILELTHDDV
ncbi:hypothetical protein PQC07_gp262 [Aeromonas phage D3]|uniref:Uncharacterized protein n=2 Tax=Ludhianavirus TaxID=3044751 RepID=A0A514TVG6_9CAUD|nr:hypothetical protein PQC07_gp262 [Aeromonas phage D3]YP_010668762.1 hypothetical protein PQC08_gp261 [Aeromonas phage D6]QDJ97012.1 hypothetical protein D3_0013 [Aeromonas phage D3]QDJ97174.1 hypothetical protein D6_0014 [Aeromonas phage D6]QEP52318.1 hypothetical protein D9_0111 [Aeromonas phage D9]